MSSSEEGGFWNVECGFLSSWVVGVDMEQAMMAGCAQAVSSSSLSRGSGAELGSSRVASRSGAAFSPVTVAVKPKQRNSCAVRATVSGNGVEDDGLGSLWGWRGGFWR